MGGGEQYFRKPFNVKGKKKKKIQNIWSTAWTKACPGKYSHVHIA